jgi:hypothetical protein
MRALQSILVCTLFACGGGPKQNAETTPANTAPTESPAGGQPCSQEVQLVCPDGQIDVCAQYAAAAAEPVDSTGEAGGTGTAMALEEGTTHHCVPK